MDDLDFKEKIIYWLKQYIYIQIVLAIVGIIFMLIMLCK